MTRKQKVKAIYRQKPELANDDIKFVLYVLERCGADITPQLTAAFERMGNPEHWTRAARQVRAEHPELVNAKVLEGREKQFVDYKYNKAVSWL